MRSNLTLAATFFALTSLPLLSQQGSQPGMPAGNPMPAANSSPQSPSAAQQAPMTATTPAAAEPAPATMSPLTGELVSKLDSRTAKTGDSVEVVTAKSAQTADGKDIPKGSKLVGKVLAVKPSASGATSQVAVVFDHLELKDGSSMPVQSQIASIGATEASAPAASPSDPGVGASATMPAGRGSSPNATNQMGQSNQTAPSNPAMNNSPGDSATPAKGMPAPGTVVAKDGNIAISTTAVPGVLLANNAPGQKDPRLSTVSSVLLGNKKDVQIDKGTPMVVMIAAAAPVK